MHVSFTRGEKKKRRTNYLICLWFSWQLKSNQERQLERLRAAAFTLLLGKHVGQLLDHFICLLWSQPTLSLALGTCSGECSKNLLVLSRWAAVGSGAVSCRERGDIPKATPKQGRHSSSLGQGMGQAPLHGYRHLRHLVLASSHHR